MSSRERDKIRDIAIAAVTGRWPGLTVTILRGSRYCFTRRVVDEPLAHYEHLLLHHRRRQRRLEGRWSYSLFPVYFLDSLPPGFQVESRIWRQSVEEDPNSLLGEMIPFHSKEAPNLLERLTDNSAAHLPVWNVYNGLDPAEISPDYLSAARALVRSKGFTMSEPTALRMGSFLKEFVPEGVRAETASFTLESNKAREKLTDFQLQDPQNFFLHLIAGAIAGGAPEVHLYVDSDDIIVSFEGEKLTDYQLKNLFSSLLAGRASSREREIAVAFNAALSLRPSILHLDSWHEGGGIRLAFVEGKEKVSELTEGTPGHKAHFRNRVSLEVAKRFLAGRNGRPEFEVAADRFRHAPVPVRDDQGTDLRGLPEAGVLGALIFEHPDHALPEFSVPAELLERTASPVDASVAIVFGPAPGLHWMVHGMAYDPPTGYPIFGMWVLVSDDKASRDLSFSRIVIDKRVEDIATKVSRLCDDFLQKLLRDYSGLSTEEQRIWLPALHQLLLSGVKLPNRLPMFEIVAGDLVDRATVSSRPRIDFSERNFLHPLESGVEVFVLKHRVREWFGSRQFVDRTSELEELDNYHRKRAAWKTRTPEVDLITRARGRFSRPFRYGDGLFSLLRKPATMCRCEYFSGRRLLDFQKFGDLPEGLLIVVSSEKFRRDMRWEQLLRDDAVKAAEKEIRQELPGFYRAVMREGPELGEYALSYVLYRKRQGENWQNHLDEVTLPTLSGGSTSLRVLLTGTAWEELPPNLRDLEGSLRASVQRRKRILQEILSKASVPLSVLLRVRELK